MSQSDVRIFQGAILAVARRGDVPAFMSHCYGAEWQNHDTHTRKTPHKLGGGET